jgi:hypothetical protein
MITCNFSVAREIGGSYNIFAVLYQPMPPQNYYIKVKGGWNREGEGRSDRERFDSRLERSSRLSPINTVFTFTFFPHMQLSLSLGLICLSLFFFFPLVALGCVGLNIANQASLEAAIANQNSWSTTVPTTLCFQGPFPFCFLFHLSRICEGVGSKKKNFTNTQNVLIGRE